jgi:hypothetical protein
MGTLPFELIRARDGHLLATAMQKKLRLYTTRDSTNPLLLSETTLAADVRSIAFSAPYVVVSVGNHELAVYDITDAYAPVLVNRIVNTTGTTHDELVTYGGVFASKGSDGVHWGNVLGPKYATLPSTSDAIDLAVDHGSLFVLRPTVLERRSLTDPAAAPETFVHEMPNPLALEASPQRVLVRNADRVLVALSAPGGPVPTVTTLGTLAQPARGAALSGEILALQLNEHEIVLYDMA